MVLMWHSGGEHILSPGDPQKHVFLQKAEANFPQDSSTPPHRQLPQALGSRPGASAKHKDLFDHPL